MDMPLFVFARIMFNGSAFLWCSCFTIITRIAPPVEMKDEITSKLIGITKHSCRMACLHVQRHYLAKFNIQVHFKLILCYLCIPFKFEYSFCMQSLNELIDDAEIASRFETTKLSWTRMDAWVIFKLKIKLCPQ